MRIVKLVVAVLVLVLAAPVSSRNRLARRPCAQYNSAAEATFRGHSSGSSGSDLPGIAFHPEAGGWQNHRGSSCDDEIRKDVRSDLQAW